MINYNKILFLLDIIIIHNSQSNNSARKAVVDTAPRKLVLISETTAVLFMLLFL